MITVYGVDEGTRKEKGQKGTTGEPRFCRSFAKALVAAAGLDKGSNDTVPERVYRGLPFVVQDGLYSDSIATEQHNFHCNRYNMLWCLSLA